MTEGAVPDIVQKRCESRGVLILCGYGWYVLVTIIAECPSMSGVSLKGADHALRSFYDTP